MLEILSREIGKGLVLKGYFDRMQLVETINQIVQPPGEELSGGEAVGALAAMILNQRHAVYRMEPWAEESLTLASIERPRPTTRIA
mgnify:CR=1 FL=1